MTEPAVLDAELATKGERTRQRILEIAITRFGERGYRATSVSEIARAAGLTQAAAYAYFPSKEALFEAAVDADAAAIIDQGRAGAEGTDIHNLVPTLLILLLGQLEAHPLARRVLSGKEQEQLTRLVNLESLRDLTRWVAEQAAEAQREGRARDDIDPVVFADGVETMLLGLLMAITQVGGTTELRRQIGVVTIWDRMLRDPEMTVAAP